MRKITLPIIAFMTIVGIYSCSSSDSPTIGTSSPVIGQTDSQTQQTVKFSASSSTVKVLTILSKAYQEKDPTIKIESFSDTQSSGAIASLKNNIVDIAGSSNKLKPEDENGKIQYRELAQDLLIVATHNSVKDVTNLSTAQLRSIYKGDITNWKELGGPNAEIVLLDRPEDESAKKLLRKYYLKKDKTTAKAIILQKEGDMINTIKSTPFAIGAFSMAASVNEQLPVNPLSLDDIAPTAENLTDGKYQMSRHLWILWHKTPKPSTQKLIDFMFSPEGSQILKEKGFIIITHHIHD
jgi:phosphate transport system substrate-binding protein